MSLTDLVTTISLDVYDHDNKPQKYKAIALDNKARVVIARITYNKAPYDIGHDTTVTLTVLWPNNTGVQIT